MRTRWGTRLANEQRNKEGGETIRLTNTCGELSKQTQHMTSQHRDSKNRWSDLRPDIYRTSHTICTPHMKPFYCSIFKIWDCWRFWVQGKEDEEVRSDKPNKRGLYCDRQNPHTKSKLTTALSPFVSSVLALSPHLLSSTLSRFCRTAGLF